MNFKNYESAVIRCYNWTSHIFRLYSCWFHPAAATKFWNYEGKVKKSPIFFRITKVPMLGSKKLNSPTQKMLPIHIQTREESSGWPLLVYLSNKILFLMFILDVNPWIWNLTLFRCREPAELEVYRICKILTCSPNETFISLQIFMSHGLLRMSFHLDYTGPS